MATQSDRKRELLVDELAQAVGEERVERADLDLDRALERQPSNLGAAFASSRLLLIVIGAVLAVVWVIASLGGGRRCPPAALSQKSSGPSCWSSAASGPP